MSDGSNVVAVHDHQDGTQERRRGLAHVREDEARGLTGVIVTALSEAHRMACDADIAQIRRERDIDLADIGEMLVCVETADHYLRMLQDVVRANGANPMDPWAPRHPSVS